MCDVPQRNNVWYQRKTDTGTENIQSMIVEERLQQQTVSRQ